MDADSSAVKDAAATDLEEVIVGMVIRAVVSGGVGGRRTEAKALGKGVAVEMGIGGI